MLRKNVSPSSAIKNESEMKTFCFVSNCGLLAAGTLLEFCLINQKMQLCCVSAVFTVNVDKVHQYFEYLYIPYHFAFHEVAKSDRKTTEGQLKY